MRLIFRPDPRHNLTIKEAVMMFMQLHDVMELTITEIKEFKDTETVGRLYYTRDVRIKTGQTNIEFTMFADSRDALMLGEEVS